MPSKLPRIIVSFLVLASLTSCISEKLTARRNITVAFYNVENLFDTFNSQGYRDAEFTPDGTKLWNGTRYMKKIDDIARVIGSKYMGGVSDHFPVYFRLRRY